jgi:hypothetical protein
MAVGLGSHVSEVNLLSKAFEVREKCLGRVSREQSLQFLNDVWSTLALLRGINGFSLLIAEQH